MSVVSAVAGIFAKLFSRIILKICKWALVKMSLSSTSKKMSSGFNSHNNINNGHSLKLTKWKDCFHMSNCIRNWMRKLLFLCALIVIIAFIWFFSDYKHGGLSTSDDTSSNFCEEEKAQFLAEHFNVSTTQLHHLAFLFSQQDQITSLECSREPKFGTSGSNAIACALKVLCSGKAEFYKQHRRVFEIGKPIDQCPVHDTNIITDYGLPMPWQSASSSVSPDYTSFKKRFLQTCRQGKYAQVCCEEFSLCLVTACCLVFAGVMVHSKMSGECLKSWRNHNQTPIEPHSHLVQPKQQQAQTPKGTGKWRKKFLKMFVFIGMSGSIGIFWYLNGDINMRREETLANMCDERARMLQDQFNVSLNHVHALAILVSTFHHGKQPSAIDQKTFGKYTERTAFERPLTSGVAYALKVTHSEREEFEKEHGWTIKKMETEDQTLVQDCVPENLDPAPIRDEYAPVIFSQETVSHIVSIDMMSGKEDRENILRARRSGKGVLTSPFKLLKSNHLGVILTFAVYNTDLPSTATPDQRIEATVGYLGASYDVPSLVEKLLHQLASKQTIVVNVYDTTNKSAPINMYGTDVVDTGLLRISKLDFGDPLRKHEMHCRFKQKPSLPWTAINAAVGVLVITLLLEHIFHAAVNRIAKVEDDYLKMMELKIRAEAADVAKSQFLATVSHEIRTPMNGVLGMLQMLMDTDLDTNQQDFAQTAHASGRDLISLINEVLDQAKIESGRLELETVPFDPRSVLDNVLSLFSGKSHEKGIELAAYISDQVPDVVVGDPGRFRQIITNLVGNSIKFTHNKGHIFVSVHMENEVRLPLDVRDHVLAQRLEISNDTLSGSPVVDRWKSWENFKKLNNVDLTEESDVIKLLITVEDTGVGIPIDAQNRIFMPFMQADSSTSRTYGGTGIGLSISKCLVDLMDGEIGFVSEPGTGSTFSFTVALRKGEAISLDPKWLHYSPYISEFRGLRALVVDERSIRADVTRYHLQRLGILVELVPSLESACTYISRTSTSRKSSTQVAMVLVEKDVWNDEGGNTLSQLVKEYDRDAATDIAGQLSKIFLMATSVSLIKRNELKSAGIVDNILVKPLRLSVLNAFLQESLGNGKKRLANRGEPVTLGILLKEKRILVVDDNGVNRRVAEGALKKYGAIVTCVDSGKAALQMLKPPHNFDACFMDIQMPEMDGFEATRRIRYMESKFNEKIDTGEATTEMVRVVDHWHTPILAMTADVIQARNEECMKCGMDGYVAKPFDEEQLYSAVAHFFESGR